MALQFACVVELPSNGNGKDAKKGKGKKSKTASEGGVDGTEGGGCARVVLEAVTRRESSLALFHLMGKVLYNKRKLPIHLSRFRLLGCKHTDRFIGRFITGKGDPRSSSASAKDIQREKELDARTGDPPPLPVYLSSHERRTSRVDVDVRLAHPSIFCSLTLN
jgi:cell cycle checkpoint protein